MVWLMLGTGISGEMGRKVIIYEVLQKEMSALKCGYVARYVCSM